MRILSVLLVSLAACAAARGAEPPAPAATTSSSAAPPDTPDASPAATNGVRIALEGQPVAAGLRSVGPFPITVFAHDHDFWTLDQRVDGVLECTTRRHRNVGKDHVTDRHIEHGEGAERYVGVVTTELLGLSPRIEGPVHVRPGAARSRTLQAPRAKHEDGGRGEGVALCGRPIEYTVVGQSADAVVLIPRSVWVREQVIAYHPDDAVLWYTSRAACDADALRKKQKQAAATAVPPCGGNGVRF